MQNWHFQRSEGSSILCHIAAISGLYNTLTLISDHSYHCIDATCNNQNGHKLRCSELISGTKALQFVTFAGQRLWALLLVNCIMGGVFNEAAWRKIYFQDVFYEYWHGISTEKYLFYCYANFIAKRLLLTKKKHNLSEFNSNVVGYQITLPF